MFRLGDPSSDRQVKISDFYTSSPQEEPMICLIKPEYRVGRLYCAANVPRARMGHFVRCPRQGFPVFAEEYQEFFHGLCCLEYGKASGRPDPSTIRYLYYVKR